jgi:type IV pilus assembly protein PilE
MGSALDRASLGALRRSLVPSLSAGTIIVKVKQGYRFNSGFTLIELMITVTVIGILAAIAIPSYRQYIIRGNRSAAESVMMDLANREQQFLLSNRSYSDAATLTANGYTLPSNVSQNYTWNVTAGVDVSSSAPIFTITFTPINGQSSDVTLTLDNQGTKTPLASWTH